MKLVFILPVFLSVFFTAQTIENGERLERFSKKLKENAKVSNILFLGDSHIQAGWIPKVLRAHFQRKYGHAGRGTVFPYSVANSNGPQDFTSCSNQAWETFRLVYDQDVFSEIGALGFVMGNKKESFLEIRFQNPEDAFDVVKIFNDALMSDEQFEIYDTEAKLEDFVKWKKNILKYTVQQGETFPELAAKFNVVTTRLVQLNGSAIKNPRAGQVVTVEKSEPQYEASFETHLNEIGIGKFGAHETIFKYPQPTNQFLIKMNATKGNIFYGFQFLKSNVSGGVVFNTVGVNGATYQDFTKFPLELRQLKTINPDLVIISLGTNEGVSGISKEDFIKNVGNLILELRKESENLSILLLSPTDNNMNGKKTAEVVNWIKEASEKFGTAYLNMYTATGGKGYFTKALKEKKASTDTVHFLQSGYEEQGELIWKAFENYLK